MFLSSTAIPASKKIVSGKRTFLLPDYDEYGIGYKDRSAISNYATTNYYVKRDHPVFNHMVVVDGVFRGTWKRTVKNNSIVIETTFFSVLTVKEKTAVYNAVKKYAAFFGKSLVYNKTI